MKPEVWYWLDGFGRFLFVLANAPRLERAFGRNLAAVIPLPSLYEAMPSTRVSIEGGSAVVGNIGINDFGRSSPSSCGSGQSDSSLATVSSNVADNDDSLSALVVPSILVFFLAEARSGDACLDQPLRPQPPGLRA